MFLNPFGGVMWDLFQLTKADRGSLEFLGLTRRVLVGPKEVHCAPNRSLLKFTESLDFTMGLTEV